MKRIKPFIPLISLFCLALLVRIIYNLTVARQYYPLHDSLGYQTLAFHILDEHCFCWQTQSPAVDRAPLWPFIIASLSLIVGRANIFDRLFLCCADAGTCVLIYLFVCRLFNKRLALVAGLIACIYPALYIYTGWMYTETLYTFLQMAICYCILCIQRNEGKSKRLWILCGVLLALLSFTRPNGLLVIGLVVLWAIFLVWRKHLPKKMLLNVALSVLVACALIAPWTIRNYVVSHSLVPVATGDGTVLLGVYNDESLALKGGWIGPGSIDPQVSHLYTSACSAPCEIARENIETDTALQWIRSHLRTMPRLLVYHLHNFFVPYTGETDMPLDRFPNQLSSKMVRAMSDTFPIPIFLLAAFGLLVTLKRYWQELLFAYLVILGTLAEALIFYGTARFRLPIEPLLIILAAGAFWWLTQKEPGTLRWKLKQQALS